jgi:restriction system protein
VKASESAADVKLLRELVGTMDSFKAGQGLLVCWGGFTQPLKNEARQNAFKVRLWDQSELVQAIYRTYEKLTPEIQAELPLKKSWMLVREDIEE